MTDNPEIKFVWEPSTDSNPPVLYTVEIGTGDIVSVITTADGGLVSRGDVLVVRVTVPVGDIGGTGDYAWRLVSIDGDGNSADSGARLFTLADDFTPPRAPILRQPASGDTVDSFATDNPATTFTISPNPPKDTDGRREDSGRGWVRELQGRWPGVLG